MKYSIPFTSVVILRPDPPMGGANRVPLLKKTSSSAVMLKCVSPKGFDWQNFIQTDVMSNWLLYILSFGLTKFLLSLTMTDKSQNFSTSLPQTSKLCTATNRMHSNDLEACWKKWCNSYAPGLKGPPGASSVWIIRLSVCPFVRLSVIPSRLQTKCNI